MGSRRWLAIATVVGGLQGPPAYGQSTPAAPAPPVHGPGAAATSSPAAGPVAGAPAVTAASPPGPLVVGPGGDLPPPADAGAGPGVGGEAVPAEEVGPPPSAALALSKEGRRLLKAKDLPGALAKLQEAVAKGQQENLDPEVQSGLHSVYGLVLLRADQDDQALVQFQAAVTLDPKDAEARVELAAQLLEADKPERAKAEAELALKLGLTDKEDVERAQKVIKDAKSQLVHDRLELAASVTWGYDSNVLQGGPIIQIANRNTRTQRATAALANWTHNDKLRSLRTGDAAVVIANYVAPSPSTAEWDLPINLDLDLAGRLFSKSGVEMWLGYHFQQTFMTSVGFDHDDYNFQQHEVPLRLEFKPTAWFFLRLKAEGFVNFSGLQTFSPYQGGLNASGEAWFTESRRWRTRVIYLHQLRRSFDQANDGYLDADRDDAKLIQELRLRTKTVKVRGSLGYRFRSDRSGVFTTTQDFDLDTALTMQAPSSAKPCVPLSKAPCTHPPLVTDPATGKLITDSTTGQYEVRLGTYSYSAPLTYFSHELSTRWTVTVPGGRGGPIELLASFAWEYFSYPTAYTANFSQPLLGVPIMSPDPDIGNWAVLASDKMRAMPDQQRTDNLFSVFVGVTKRLPHDVSIELSYALYKNISTVANYLDNRSYDKNVVQLGGSYTF